MDPFVAGNLIVVEPILGDAFVDEVEVTVLLDFGDHVAYERYVLGFAAHGECEGSTSLFGKFPRYV